MGISDIMERQMKDMKRKLPFRKVAVFLILALFLTAGISMRAVTVNAATYVKQDRTSVSITSGKTGWQKIGGDYYFYNSKGRLICGSFKYKGYYYYSIANGKRFTGWMKRSGNKYYYNRKMVPCSVIAGLQEINIPITLINPAWQLPGSGLLRMEKILFPQQFHHGKGLAEDRKILLLFQQENRSDGKKYLDR